MTPSNNTANGKPLVVFVLPYLTLGGTERATFFTIRGLLARGYRVDLLLLSTHIAEEIIHWIPDGAKLFSDKQYAGDKTEITVLPPRTAHWISDYLKLIQEAKYLPRPQRLQNTRLIASYITHRQPDIVFSGLEATHRTLLTHHLLNHAPPIVPVMHAPLKTKYRHHRRRLYQNAAHMVSVSEGRKQHIQSEIGLPAERITTIYNPVVTPEMATLKEQKPDHPWFSDGGAPIVLGCGRLCAQKNFSVLVRAFAHLNKTRPSRLIIMGEGKLRGELEQLISDLGIADSVSLPGWVDNIYAYMSHSQLFALSSDYETMGLVLAEALACGCPCVSTDSPSGPAEILLNGEIGKCVPVGDDHALAEAMRETLDAPPPKEKLIARGEHFSLDRATNEYEKLIGEVIEKHKEQRL